MRIHYLHLVALHQYDVIAEHREGMRTVKCLRRIDDLVLFEEEQRGATPRSPDRAVAPKRREHEPITDHAGFVQAAIPVEDIELTL